MQNGDIRAASRAARVRDRLRRDTHAKICAPIDTASRLNWKHAHIHTQTHTPRDENGERAPMPHRRFTVRFTGLKQRSYQSPTPSLNGLCRAKDEDDNGDSDSNPKNPRTRHKAQRSRKHHLQAGWHVRTNMPASMRSDRAARLSRRRGRRQRRRLETALLFEWMRLAVRAHMRFRT